MTPFPTAFPSESVQVLVSHFRTHVPGDDHHELRQAAWNVLGYALGRLDGHPPGATPADFNVADALEQVHPVRAAQNPEAGRQWGPIAKKILDLLVKLLLTD